MRDARAPVGNSRTRTADIVARSDINEYANALLLEFLDAFHEQLRSDLRGVFSEKWLDEGVLRHVNPQYVDRTRHMLESPMRVVDMGKTDEELYGVEHLWNIVNAHWKTLYEPRFQDKKRRRSISARLRRFGTMCLIVGSGTSCVAANWRDSRKTARCFFDAQGRRRPPGSRKPRKA